jgi:hypothetical protein
LPRPPAAFRRRRSAVRVDPDAGARPGSGARRHPFLRCRSVNRLTRFSRSGRSGRWRRRWFPWSLSSCPPWVHGGAAQPPFGSMADPSPARTCVLVVIGPRAVSRCRRCADRCPPAFPCSCSWCPRCVGGCGPGLAVRVHLAAAARADRAGDRHRNLPVELLVERGTVSRAGLRRDPSASLRPRGWRCGWSSSPLVRVAVGRRAGRGRCLRRRGSRCGSSSSSLLQDVWVVIVASRQAGGGPPCGSMPVPSPARIEVWVVISVSPSA